MFSPVKTNGDYGVYTSALQEQEEMNQVRQQVDEPMRESIDLQLMHELEPWELQGQMG